MRAFGGASACGVRHNCWRILVECAPAVVLMIMTTAAWAQGEPPLRGVALVVGQSQYEHLSPLPNPANDADQVEALLSDLGFDSVRRTDRDAATLARDLERFAEDAKDSDVAVLYYSGHGIEAGGENYLVPIDADLAALDEAAGKLVPVSGLIEKLKATVPVAIVMLDACRDNPFPPNKQLRTGPDATPVPISASGLGPSRGAVSLKAPIEGPSDEANIGTVIAFAAEPGKVALDGEAGGNSPYAAAVLRHFDAMAGEEFGTVMRMVAEEVYLKTGGRQRPWVNESLRRLIYFGEKPTSIKGDEGEILRERRQLLVTIAALPDADRRMVERVAKEGGVPMDALYAMLKAIEAESAADPADLEKILHVQARRLKQVLAERKALNSSDPEIRRLSDLADEASNDGAIETAIKFLERAKRRVAEIDQILDLNESMVRARRIENAFVFARAAEAYSLTSQFDLTAQDYENAFLEVEKWDNGLAWKYKLGRVTAINAEAERGGKLYNDLSGPEFVAAINADRVRLYSEAISNGTIALRLADGLDRPEAWAATQQEIGRALVGLSVVDGDLVRFQRGIAAFTTSLDVRTREGSPLLWAETQHNIGYSHLIMHDPSRGTHHLEQAAEAFRLALQVRSKAAVPRDWAETQVLLGDTLKQLGTLGTGTEHFQEATVAFKAALEVFRFPSVEWYRPQMALADVLIETSNRTGEIKILQDAIEVSPTEVDGVQVGAGVRLQRAKALRMLSDRTDNAAALEEAITIYRSALPEYRNFPFFWVEVNSDLGEALQKAGKLTHDPSRIEEAISVHQASFNVYTRERTPSLWAREQLQLGDAYSSLGVPTGDVGKLRLAAEAYISALSVLDRERDSLAWALAQNDLGDALSLIGEKEDGVKSLGEAVAVHRASLEVLSKTEYPQIWGETHLSISIALATLGERSGQSAFYTKSAQALSEARETFRGTGEHDYDQIMERVTTYLDGKM